MVGFQPPQAKCKVFPNNKHGNEKVLWPSKGYEEGLSNSTLRNETFVCAHAVLCCTSSLFFSYQIAKGEPLDWELSRAWRKAARLRWRPDLPTGGAPSSRGPRGGRSGCTPSGLEGSGKLLFPIDSRPLGEKPRGPKLGPVGISIRGPELLSVVCFSRGTLPTKKVGKRPLLGHLGKVEQRKPTPAVEFALRVYPPKCLDITAIWPWSFPLEFSHTVFLRLPSRVPYLCHDSTNFQPHQPAAARARVFLFQLREAPTNQRAAGSHQRPAHVCRDMQTP